MPISVWHCEVVSGAGSCLVPRIGPVTSGIGRTEATRVAALAAGAAASAPGTASDSAASPPTAATGRTIRAVTLITADRPWTTARPVRDAALSADFRENTGIPLL